MNSRWTPYLLSLPSLALFSLMVLLPLITDWADFRQATWPSWWSLLLVAASTSLIAAIINANLPVTPREMIKSVALGFALNATLIMLGLV